MYNTQHTIHNRYKEILTEYFQHLHQCYEDWLITEKFGSPPAPVLILDADQGMDSMLKIFEKYKVHSFFYIHDHINVTGSIRWERGTKSLTKIDIHKISLWKLFSLRDNVQCMYKVHDNFNSNIFFKNFNACFQDEIRGVKPYTADELIPHPSNPIKI